MQMVIHGVQVHGVDIDSRTGCAHYRSELDIIAIKFKCCGAYYPCYDCHEAEASHPARVWQRFEFGEKAVLCGACGQELTIDQYLQCGAVCPACQSGFNPGCKYHYHLYFAT